MITSRINYDNSIPRQQSYQKLLNPISAHAIEINPIDTYGSITKKRGVVIRSASELDDISRLLSHPKVDDLSKKIDAVNPKREAITSKGGPGIFEI